jgi:hypothetical protein
MVLSSGAPITVKSSRSKTRESVASAWLIQRAFSGTGVPEIKALEQTLRNLPGVEKIKCIVDKPGDLHNITFLVYAPNEVDENGNFAKVGKLWQATQKLASEARKQLRDSTGERWCFRTELVNDLSPSRAYSLM